MLAYDNFAKVESVDHDKRQAFLVSNVRFLEIMMFATNRVNNKQLS